MKIVDLKLDNYRNYDKLKLRLNENLNIIIGDNAQGKTNIIEAIYVLSITKSFLSINEKKIIKFGEDFFKSSANLLYDDGAAKNLEIIVSKSSKKVKINGNEIKKIADYISNINVILFSPDNIRMVKEEPTRRRKYLNVELSQLYNKYLTVINEYNHLLKQKNEFLKVINIENKSNSDYLEIINKKLADYAVSIYIYRNNYIKMLNEQIVDIYRQISDGGEVEIKYVSNIEFDNNIEVMKEKLLSKLELYKDKEIYYKTSIIGPHRDDFFIYLDGKDLALYGSQGQIRIALLALKLADIPIFINETKEKPILLLDDIFSELDIDKRNKLIKYLDNDIQTIITTTDVNSINSKLLEKAEVFVIKKGKIINRKDDNNG